MYSWVPKFFQTFPVAHRNGKMFATIDIIMSLVAISIEEMFATIDIIMSLVAISIEE
ncbi:MAG: hypothetical protein QXG01_06490 [Candidatus Bathyarchaeia archaeon]